MAWFRKKKIMEQTLDEKFPLEEILLFKKTTAIIGVIALIIYIICFITSNKIQSFGSFTALIFGIIWLASAYIWLICFEIIILVYIQWFSLFYYLNKTQGYLHQPASLENNKKTKSFQKDLKNLERLFLKIFNINFREYKKYITTYDELYYDICVKCNRVHYLAIMSVLRNTKQEKSLLTDFGDYLDNLQKDIIIPTLNKNINIDTAQCFFTKWDSQFKRKFKKRYNESENFLKIHRDRIHIKYEKWSTTKTTILISVVVVILSALASKDFILFLFGK